MNITRARLTQATRSRVTARTQQPGAPAGAPAGNPPAGSPPATPPATPPRTFTQQELADRAAAEKDQGRRAGQREVLEALGVEDLEGARALAQRLADDDARTKTQAQKDAEQAAKDKAAAERDRREAANERAAARRERLLQLAGAPAPAETALMLSSLPVDADDATTQAAIDALKEKLPALFVAAPATPPATPPDGSPGRPPAAQGPAVQRVPAPAGAGGTSWGERGRAEAAARRPQPRTTG